MHRRVAHTIIPYTESQYALPLCCTAIVLQCHCDARPPLRCCTALHCRLPALALPLYRALCAALPLYFAATPVHCTTYTTALPTPLHCVVRLCMHARLCGMCVCYKMAAHVHACRHAHKCILHEAYINVISQTYYHTPVVYILPQCHTPAHTRTYTATTCYKCYK